MDRDRALRGTVRAVVAVAVLAVSCSACTGDDVPTDPTPATSGSDAPAAGDTTVADRGLAAAPDAGVRTVADTPSGPVAVAGEPRRVQLDDVPRWIVGLPLEGGGVGLVVVTETDEVHALEIGAGTITSVQPPTEAVDWHRPPVLDIGAAGTVELLAPPADASGDAPVRPLGDGRLAYVGADGELVVRRGGVEERRHDLDLLPDTWLIPVGDGRLAALAAPTDAYGHGVLGDVVEARSVVLVGPDTGEVTTRIDVVGVVEGLRPEVGRLPGHDGAVLAVTVSDDAGGADVVAYDLDGRVVASTGPIGTGDRWRHVIAVDGEVGLVEVVTPHLGKELRIATIRDGRLVPTLSRPGVMSSHAIGSRDLDEAKLLQVDGRPAVVGPGPDRDTLVAIAAEDGAVVAEHPLNAGWASNLAAVEGAGIGVVAVGLEDGSVLVWSTAR